MGFYEEMEMSGNGIFMQQNTGAVNFKGFGGIVTEIRHFYNEEGQVERGYYFITVENSSKETATLLASPSTYFLDCNIKTGDSITGYYDGNAPVPMIYPPQYNVRVILKNKNDRNVKVSYFDENLISLDNTLQIMISDGAFITYENGKPYCGDLRNRNLVVIYGVSTRSIPALTRPYVIIVMED